MPLLLEAAATAAAPAGRCTVLLPDTPATGSSTPSPCWSSGSPSVSSSDPMTGRGSPNSASRSGAKGRSAPNKLACSWNSPARVRSRAPTPPPPAAAAGDSAAPAVAGAPGAAVAPAPTPAAGGTAARLCKGCCTSPSRNPSGRCCCCCCCCQPSPLFSCHHGGDATLSPAPARLSPQGLTAPVDRLSPEPSDSGEHQEVAW
jgi:hypothetical protein